MRVVHDLVVCSTWQLSQRVTSWKHFELLGRLTFYTSEVFDLAVCGSRQLSQWVPSRQHC